MRRCLFLLLVFHQAVCGLPSTLFHYTREEISTVEQLSSERTMRTRELRRWDRIAEQAIHEQGLPEYQGLRILTYLYVAQSEAAALSVAANCSYMGSLNSVSYGLLTLFFPNLRRPHFCCEDLYSRTLATLVLNKLKQRLDEERDNTARFVSPDCQPFSEGLDVASWKPWCASPPEKYWPAPPPPRESPFWSEQISLIQRAQYPVTPYKKRAALFWGGIHGPGLNAWRIASNQYLFSHCLSLEPILQVRFALGIARYDGTIVLFGAKYAYDVPRPQTVRHMLPVPLNPSYPSGHSLESAISFQILSCLLPGNQRTWMRMASQASLSRVWGGAHHPIDVQAGWEAGIKIADQVLEALAKPAPCDQKNAI